MFRFCCSSLHSDCETNVLQCHVRLPCSSDADDLPYPSHVVEGTPYDPLLYLDSSLYDFDHDGVVYELNAAERYEKREKIANFVPYWLAASPGARSRMSEASPTALLRSSRPASLPFFPEERQAPEGTPPPPPAQPPPNGLLKGPIVGANAAAAYSAGPEAQAAAQRLLRRKAEDHVLSAENAVTIDADSLEVKTKARSALSATSSSAPSSPRKAVGFSQAQAPLPQTLEGLAWDLLPPLPAPPSPRRGSPQRRPRQGEPPDSPVRLPSETVQHG